MIEGQKQGDGVYLDEDLGILYQGGWHKDLK